MAYTAWSESYNVYRRAGGRGYSESMPLVFGIGLSPLLQWLILPPVLVIAYRKLGPLRFGRNSSRSPIAAQDLTRTRK